MNFNSNLDKCCDYRPTDLSTILNSLSGKHTNSEPLEHDIIEPNFKYYDTHQFHKLKLANDEKKIIYLSYEHGWTL